MLDGGTGNSAQLRSRSPFRPWNSPASTRTRVPFDSTRYFEPVTVRAAPRNVRLIIGSFRFLQLAMCSHHLANSSEEVDLAAGMPEKYRPAEFSGPRTRAARRSMLRARRDFGRSHQRSLRLDHRH